MCCSMFCHVLPLLLAQKWSITRCSCSYFCDFCLFFMSSLGCVCCVCCLSLLQFLLLCLLLLLAPVPVVASAVHRWCAAMVCTDGVHQWCAPMVCTNGVHQWCAAMVLVLVLGLWVCDCCWFVMSWLGCVWPADLPCLCCTPCVF